jgi:hypothetical protein
MNLLQQKLLKTRLVLLALVLLLVGSAMGLHGLITAAN